MLSEPIVLFLLGTLAAILFGVAVLVARRLVAGPRDFSRDDALDLTLAVVGWVLITSGFVAVFLVLLPVIGLALLVAALVVIAETLVKHRLSRQYALLWLMTVAAERLIPLVPAIEAFAREGGGSLAGRARYLANMLKAGVPLPDALERVPGLFPPEVLPVISVGYESGALAAALRQAASVHDFRRPLWLAMAGRLIYLMTLVAFGSTVVAFVMYRIVPSFEKIFADFGTRLPAMTETLVAASRVVVEWWFLLLPLLLLLFLLFVYVLLRYVGLVHWELPGTNWLARRLDAAAILEALALAAEYQRPLPEALATLARTYPKASIRRRLRDVARDLDGGADWCESLFARGLIKRPDLAILQAAQRAGNLPWAMREMADSNRRRLAYRLYALVQMLFPPVILAFALLELFFVAAVLFPLIKLIQTLV
jgi:type II secretory pathway component PulF